jgi:hypothetical protein
MGHVDDSMAANYRHEIAHERLQAVVDYVHDWLFAAAAEDQDADQSQESADDRQPDAARPAEGGQPHLRFVG